MLYTTAFASIFVVFGVAMWMRDRRLHRSPYGRAIARVPRLCRASAAPIRPQAPPRWLDALVTLPRDRRPHNYHVHCVLPDLLDGAVEVAVVEHKRGWSAIVRCPHVPAPREFSRGTVVATGSYLSIGRESLTHAAKITTRTPGHSSVAVWIGRGQGVLNAMDERTERALLAAINTSLWHSPYAIEFVDGQAHVVYYCAFMRWLRPEHIAAACEALCKDARDDPTASTPSRMT